MARIQRQAQAGRGQWFGLWCDGTLAADGGLGYRDLASRWQLQRNSPHDRPAAEAPSAPTPTATPDTP